MQARTGNMEAILLIHPDPVMRQELTLLLQDSGFQVVSVSGGQEALADISSVWPDLILLAEGSHRLNGDELCDFTSKPDKRCVCLLSGGIDSAAGAVWASEQGLSPTFVSHCVLESTIPV